MARVLFDKLYINGPTGDQYEGVERINDKADVEFVKDIKDLPSPDQLPKDLKKLMIFDDVRAKEPVINEYFCRGRHNNCNMIYLNLFTIDRMLEIIAIYLFYLNKELRFSYLYIKISLIMLNLVISILLIDVIRYGKSLIIILSLI